ncbi:hypothetical protein D9757_003537 [Collybiopsis confluens]|uniref:Alpha/beta hydrolase fold-3 domain-containing protein n=1 Tax=Collybiopsis confluens TaxID=2823264 RepID=A0A8H5HTL1_9AGAR|nr:hypothetical protein D9757_003537 [Collybiopsis confluens]
MYDTKKNLSVSETLSLLGVLGRLPFYLIFVVSFSPLLPHTKGKSLKRVISEAFPGFLIAKLSVRQIQRLLGPSTKSYLAWAKKNAVVPVIEDIGTGDAKLIWLTEKKTDKVFLYAHGKSLFHPICCCLCKLCSKPPRESKISASYPWYTASNFHYGPSSKPEIIFLALHPAKFPTQLAELTTALNQLISSGVSPENIVLAGDSAGGNLIVQLIQHTMRPFPGIPTSPFSSENADTPRKELGGIWLISPWISLGSPTPSYARNTHYDWVSAAVFNYWGATATAGVPELHIPYINPSSASLLSGVEKITSRVLITAGSHECLFDDAVAIDAMIKELKIPENGWRLYWISRKEGCMKMSFLILNRLKSRVDD